MNDPECQQQGYADSYLSYKDQYEEAVRKSIVFIKKSQKLQVSGKYSENSDDYLYKHFKLISLIKSVSRIFDFSTDQFLEDN